MTLSFTSIFPSCGLKDGDEEIPTNPYVEAFTFGTISRFTPVYLIFNQDIPSAKMNVEELQKLVSIKPKVEGTYSFSGNRTIMFKPKTSFKHGTTYTFSAKLSKWFDVKGKDKKFSFTFTTLPLTLQGELKQLGVNDRNEDAYDISCSLFTPDKESPKTVESLVAFTEPSDVQWQHSADGREHIVIMRNVAPSAKKRTIHLQVASNKLDVPEEEILGVEIPAKDFFGLYKVRFVSKPERYIEVTLTKRLDETQNMDGLAYIEENKNETVTIDDNRIRLYPDEGKAGTLNVHLSGNIRNSKGVSLNSNIVTQVEVDKSLPAVRFVGEGVIIPRSKQLSVPFQAIWLRGVTVRVVRIFEQNIGQFLQNNNLNGTENLMQVGRLVALKTIFFDEGSADIGQWNTYSIDLSQLMKPEPGAIYHIQLSFNKDLSAYPCGRQNQLSKAQILANDKVKFEEELSQFDDGGYYFSSSNDDEDWNDYDYEKRDNPCTSSYYHNRSVSRNVLATDLGLMAIAGGNHEMTILIHNILTTKPESGVKVDLYNYQNQKISEGKSNGDGMLTLSYTGTPFYVIATKDNQRSYLRVDKGSALSLSDFDASGEVVQRGIKGFIYGERGVWRPGDVLHLSFMLNDRTKKLPSNIPVVMELTNPLGQLYQRQTQVNGVMGVYAFSMVTESDAPTGAWTATVKVGGATFSKRIRIETIKPNRLKINLRVPQETVLRGEALNAPMHVEWLQGAKAHNMRYEIEGTFISTKTSFSKYKDYVFDDPSKTFSNESSSLITGTTDDEGNTEVTANFNVGNSAPGMLVGNLVTRVFEESGDFSINSSRVVYSPYRKFAGILAPSQKGDHLDTGRNYAYKVASVNYDGTPAANSHLKVDVFKVEWYWWWSSDRSDLVNFVSNSFNKPIKSFDVTTNPGGYGSFNLSFEDENWGTYFIRVKDVLGNHSTGVLSYFDWPNSEGRRSIDGSNAATKLSFNTDKENYKPGDKMVVTFPSVKGSRAVIGVENGTQLLSLTEKVCDDQLTSVHLDVTEEMQPNAYVYITLLQPHGITKNDLPIRMYGVMPVSVSAENSHLTPIIKSAVEIKPEQDYQITVSEKNNRAMAFTLAVVDEGLIDLTNFQTPDPWKTFNAREALGVNTWDIYDYIVGAYGGRIEQLFSIGGDDQLQKGPKATVNRFKPVVSYVGPVQLKKGESRTIKLKMPEYVGRVKVMVVAGDGQAFGNAEKSILVRKPVMLLGTLPRVIGTEEEVDVPATVFATEKKVGTVNVSIAVSKNMQVVGNSIQTVSFSEQGDKVTHFRVRTNGSSGAGHVTLTAVGKGDKSVYNTDIEIRSVKTEQVKVMPITIQAGKSFAQTLELPGESGNSLSMEVYSVPPINLAKNMEFLRDYQYTCVEQLVSKAFPQLYLSQIASITKKESAQSEAAVKEIINKLRSYQTVDGSMSYWPGSTDVQGWASVYTAHFLTEAIARGYSVPGSIYNGLINYLRRVARSYKNDNKNPVFSSEETTEAYRLFVLALARTPELGAMNRLKEQQKLQQISRWLLASAYVLTGNRNVAKQLIASRIFPSQYDWKDETFGSNLRDTSIRLITLCLLGNDSEAAALATDISKSLSDENLWFSTQSRAFGLVAFAQYLKKFKISGEMNFSYTYSGQTIVQKSNRNLWSANIGNNLGKRTTVKFKNDGQSTLFVRLISKGTPAQGEEQSYENGISLNVNCTDLKGNEVSLDNMVQGTNFKLTATVTNVSTHPLKRLVVKEILPAGWEILNTRYLNGEETATNSMISYQDIRDDRVYSYIDYMPIGGRVTFQLKLCAVYSGRFYLPPFAVEAMYDNQIRCNTKSFLVQIE